MAKNLLTTGLSPYVRPGDDTPKVGKDNHPRPRWGKTKRDKENKAHARNADNKLIRAQWQNDGNKATQANFPYQTCNGKRNRRFITRTRKGNILITYK